MSADKNMGSQEDERRDKVQKMHPVTFDWKEKRERPWEQDEFGLIAEEREKINPVFVTYGKDGQADGVRYMQLTAVLANAIKQQQRTLDEQQAQIAALRAANDNMQAEITALKAQRQ